jgi:hypothetical protein
VDHDGEDAETLRRRLYRPGASAADLATYLHAAEAEGTVEAPVAPAAPEPSPSLRPFVVGGACVAGAALIGALLLTGATGTPAAVPTTAAPSSATAIETQESDVTGWLTVDPTDSTTQSDGSWQISFSTSSVFDSGHRPGSEGTAVADGPDHYRYLIASGDTVSGIAARFALCRADVIQSLPYGFSDGALPAGGSLELGHVSGLC